eukprot:scaffold39283_cov40-Tisochrysis_lutea.AAC.1
MLYAVETLVFFGSSGTVETLGYTSKWVEDACFPASRLRGQLGHSNGAQANGMGRHRRACSSLNSSNLFHRARRQGVAVQCVDETAIIANGVTYGRACIDNPPCGRRMFLVPKPEPCERSMAVKP